MPVNLSVSRLKQEDLKLMDIYDYSKMEHSLLKKVTIDMPMTNGSYKI